MRGLERVARVDELEVVEDPIERWVLVLRSPRDATWLPRSLLGWIVAE